MEDQSISLLSVKFKIPEPRANYVSRKKLMNLLKNIDQKKVTIVKGGAGSGKTTLLSSFIKEYDLQNIRWITLDDRMNQVFVFWKYMIEGTKDFSGEKNKDFENYFESNMQKDNLWNILSMYINKLNQEKDIVLVLDDFHNISDKFLLSTIDFFIDNMPNRFHLVMLTRVMPQIYLGTLSMDNQLLLIDERDIGMSEEESKAFLLRTLKLTIDESQIKTMVQRSNGWVGGLQLMAVAAKEQSRTTIPSFNTASRVIGDYIEKEIYGYLSEEERDFLQKTSILSYFNKKICNQYLPQYDFEEIMRSVLKKNLFVISIDEENKVYKYHSIIQDYLIGLLQKNVKQKKSLHNLAGDIYYELGDYDESLRHLFTIKSYKKIMKRLLQMPQTVVTFNYIMQVPLEAIGANKDFAYQYFFCHYASLEVDACERIYDYIINHMEEDETFTAFRHSDLFFDVNWKFKNLPVSSLKQINEMPLNAITKAYLLIKEAYFLFLSNQHQEAFMYLDTAHQIYGKTDNVYIEIFIAFEKSQILEDIGELNQALIVYQAMKKHLENVPTMKSLYYIGIAGIYLKQMALKEAKEALDLAKKLMVHHVENVQHAYLYTLAEYLYIIGNYDQTEKIIVDVMNMEVYQNIFFSVRLLRYPVCREKYKELASKFKQDYEQAGNILKNMDTDLLYIEIIYENGAIEKAFQLIDELIGTARKTKNKLKVVEAALLKINFIAEQKRSERELINLLIEVISYAYDNTIALPLWFQKKRIDFILNQYYHELSQKLSKDEINFVKHILKINQQKASKHVSQKRYDLTQRELEVLDEIKKGYTNKIIADTLCISVSTVKSHIINIYGKLGVNNRVAAINLVENKMNKRC